MKNYPPQNTDVYTRVYDTDDLDVIDPGWRERVAEEDRQELTAWLARPARERARIHRRVRSLLRKFRGTYRARGETKRCPECKSNLFFLRTSLHNAHGLSPAPVCMSCGFTPTRPHQTGELPIPEGTPDWVDV